MIVLVLLDTGCRISEALGVRVEDCNLDDLLLTVTGRRKAERRLPFSLRTASGVCKILCRPAPTRASLFHSQGSQARQASRTPGREVALQTTRPRSPERTLHAFRHTFAINYLRKGGSVFHLQKVLGHSSLEMSRRYANLMTEDLQAIHERVSLLTS